MLSEQELFASYSNRSILGGNEVYFELNIAMEFISDCQENNFAILGIEGFIPDGKYIIPQSDMITDYSPTSAGTWEEYRNSCFISAKNLIQSFPVTVGLLLNFVIFSEEDYLKSITKYL